MEPPHIVLRTTVLISSAKRVWMISVLYFSFPYVPRTDVPPSSAMVGHECSSDVLTFALSFYLLRPKFYAYLSSIYTAEKVKWKNFWLPLAILPFCGDKGSVIFPTVKEPQP
eukprot:Pompholyxophrys_sp_v1_NODE_92_length_2109_cov_15.187439.p3 type:complete len:112 gc:universal NODE_92_length_2109_cov_15.187439:1112-1447(+)